jgi:hypothetical protein
MVQQTTGFNGVVPGKYPGNPGQPPIPQYDPDSVTGGLPSDIYGIGATIADYVDIYQKYKQMDQSMANAVSGNCTTP